MASVVKEPSLQAVDGLDGLDAVVCLVPEDQRPLQGGAGFVDFRLCGALSRALADGFFRGAHGEKLLVPSEARLSPPMVFALGLGPARAVTALGLEHVLANARRMLEQALAQHVALALPTLPHLDASAAGTVVGRAFVKPWTAGRVVVLAESAAASHLDSAARAQPVDSRGAQG